MLDCGICVEVSVLKDLLRFLEKEAVEAYAKPNHASTKHYLFGPSACRSHSQ
jgi:hypothetical protein